MKFPFVLGIRARVLLAALLPMTLLAVILAAIFLRDRVNDLYDAHLQKARAMAHQIASGSVYSLFTGNRETLQHLLDEVEREEDVRSVTVIGADSKSITRAGKPSYQHLPKYSNEKIEVLNPATQTLLLAQPIYGSQLVVEDIFSDAATPKLHQLGQLVLELSTEKIVSRERDLLLVGILLSIGGLLFGSLLAIRLSRGVIAPIIEVSGMVERIAQGDLSARVHIDGSGYLRRLEEGLNLMAARIESGQQELQRQIAEATAELRVKKDEAEVAMQAISLAKNELTSIMEANPDMLYVFNMNGKLIKWNSNFEKFCGLTHKQMTNRLVTEFICKSDRSTIIKGVTETFEKGACSIEVRLVRHDGVLVPYLCNCVVLKGANGEAVAFTGTGRDISERKKAEESMLLASMVYQNSGEAIMVTDPDNAIIAVNPAFERVTGYAAAEVIGNNPRMLGSGTHDSYFFQAMWDSIIGNGHWQGELWGRKKSGELYAKFFTINTIPNPDGSVHRYVALFSDITERKKSEELIWQQANFDTLTGLPNRRMFHDRLEQEIKKAHRASLPMALMFLDLDRFKEINDTLGHDMGDILLKEASRRLSSCVRESDTVARLGGDEFGIVLGELDDPGNVERIAQGILRKLADPFQLGIETVYISASIGITLYPEDATGVDSLLKNADQAMYAAKRLGRNRTGYFTPSMQEIAQSRMRLANDLRGALDGKQFHLAYQPIVEFASGAIRKAEALIRWRHPARGLINPMDFIPISEDTGMINDICEWVFHEAAQQAGQWRVTQHSGFQVSINLSPACFQRSEGIHGTWLKHLRKLGLPGQSIAVEITEGLLLDASASVIEQLLALRDMGIQVALDDFGTGYSSLSYLKKFDIDYLKIDQTFVRNLAPASDDLALCQAIIVMAHKLDLKVIAEGVETEAQRVLLAAAGCDYGQGYLFSKAVAAEEFEALLARGAGTE
ncbi:MAG: EAL domain-containing protein [Betaproteobacteria bacterium]|nr:EAL domain-containing protein [Betaproteobacteria bacterium]